MITSHRFIGIEVKIFTNNLDELDDIVSVLRRQSFEMVEHFKKEQEAIPDNKIQIHIVSPQTCPHCKQTWSNCQCGKPNRSPLV